jgi:hypothetical protein
VPGARGIGDGAADGWVRSLAILLNESASAREQLVANSAGQPEEQPGWGGGAARVLHGPYAILGHRIRSL